MIYTMEGFLSTIMMTMFISSGVSGAAESELTARNYHIDTILIENDQTQVVIVSSSTQPAYEAIAKRVQSRILELSGVEVEIVDAEEATTEEILAESSAIVLGNLVTSRFVEALYWEWYTILDLWYPGEGGYVVRTLHDPYGTGRNVIFLGGSDDMGVSDAADAFCKTLREGEPLKVGRLMDIKLGKNHQLPPEGEWVDPRLRIFHETLEHENVHACPLGFTDATLAGLRYYYNGDETAAQRFRDLALNTDTLSHNYHYNSHLHPIIWDLIEESPIFSEEDRRKISGKLLTFARGSDGTAGRGSLLTAAKLHRESKKILDRHDAMKAVCILTHSRYLNKYWPSDEWEQNLAAVREYYDRPMTSAKGWRDEGNMHTYLECTLIAALLMRDHRLVESGALRHYAELILMFCDNRGYMTTFGSGSPSTTLRTCAALLNDGGLLATLPRREEMERATRKNPTPYGFINGQAWATGLEPAPMEKMIGVYHRPLTDWVWEHYGKTVSFEKGFDKLTMRSGFGSDDQYLFLDGISCGGGKPDPNHNCIISLHQNGRAFLSGSRNNVIVSKDGFGQKEENLVSLERSADLPKFGYTQTRIPNHPFSTWDRHIFWQKGGWFVVLDSVTAKEAGQYIIECIWHPIGGLKADGSNITATQTGGEKQYVLNIKNAEGLPMRHDPGDVYYVVSGDMSQSESEIFTNLIYVDGDEPSPSYDIAKIGDTIAILTGDELAYLGITENGIFQRGGVSVKGAAFYISPVSMAVVSGTQMQCAGCSVETSKPTNIEYDPTAGLVTVETTEKTDVTVDGQMRVCEPGTHSFETTAQDADKFAGLIEAIQNDAAVAKSTEKPAQEALDLPEIPTAWTYEAGGYRSYSSYNSGDVNGDGRDEVVIGMENGRAVCIDDKGEMLWEFKAGGAVKSIAYAAIESGPAVFLGAADEHVYAVDAKTGKFIWKYKNHWSLDRYNTAPWFTPRGEGYAISIHPHDIDGDGSVEIICGTRGGFTEVLSSAGERKWLHEFLWGHPDTFGVVPMPDGTKMLLVNSTSSPGSATYRLNGDGKELTRSAFPGEGTGSWDGMKVVDLQLSEMNGSGELNAVLAIAGRLSQVALHDAATGKLKWSKLLGGDPSGVAAADLNGDGTKEVVVGTLAGWVCAFDINGEQLWAVAMPDRVLAVAAAGDNVYVQCRDACTYRLNHKGEITGRYTLDKKYSPAWNQHWRFSICRDFLFIGDYSGVIASLKWK